MENELLAKLEKLDRQIPDVETKTDIALAMLGLSMSVTGSILFVEVLVDKVTNL